MHLFFRHCNDKAFKAVIIVKNSSEKEIYNGYWRITDGFMPDRKFL